MIILSTVCTKLLCTNAHLGRRVAAHHLKVYTRGSRNGIAILDSDKILICLRSVLHFIGSLIRKKGHSFFLKTNHFFILLIMAKMIYLIMAKMGSCIKDSQWKIGAFLTNSYANPKKFRSRKKKIHFGLNQQPDCVAIPNPDRKSSVILEANRLQIPIASLLDSTIPWESYKRIAYPIPANDTIQFIYLFRHSITKTVIRERQMRRARAFGGEGRRRIFSATSSQVRCMHGIEMLLAAAEQLAATADCLPDAANSVAEMAGNLLEPLGGADPSGSSSLLADSPPGENPIPPRGPDLKTLEKAPDFAKQLIDAGRRRLAIRQAAEFVKFQQSIEGVDPEDALKNLEKEIFLNRKKFYQECCNILRYEKPMLRGGFEGFDLSKEEGRIRCLLKFLLRSQDKEYNVPNLWHLGWDMRDPQWVLSVISPLIRLFKGKKKKGWPY
jgi:ribosomal protein S2